MRNEQPNGKRAEFGMGNGKEKNGNPDPAGFLTCGRKGV
jgi:hypothetical protein